MNSLKRDSVKGPNTPTEDVEDMEDAEDTHVVSDLVVASHLNVVDFYVSQYLMLVTMDYNGLDQI